MVFIGYESGTKGYILFHLAISKLVVSRDVIFYESKPWDWNNSLSNTDKQGTETFNVHYEETDINSIIAGNTEKCSASYYRCSGGGVS
jgi:hypothetical protein